MSRNIEVIKKVLPSSRSPAHPPIFHDRPAWTQRRLPRWRRPPPQLCVRRDAEEGDVQEADTATEQRECQLLQGVYCDRSRCCPSCDKCSHSHSSRSRSRYSYSTDSDDHTAMHHTNRCFSTPPSGLGKSIHCLLSIVAPLHFAMVWDVQPHVEAMLC